MMHSSTMFWVIWFLAGLFLSPLLPGIINKVKAFFAGRKGPSLFQLYYDLAKLLKKEPVCSVTSGGVLRLAPLISLASILAAAVLIPYGSFASPFGFTGDIILFFYLLGTARMATVLGALDTGSSFEGMGSSREMQFSALAESVIFSVIGFLAVLTRRGSLNMLAQVEAMNSLHFVSVWMTAGAFFVVLLMENCRVPADDPETHLELTMIHEAMILDYGGSDLALILYGSSLKFWLFASFFVLLVIPAFTSPLLSGGIFLLGIVLTTVFTGMIESCMARYRFLKMPQMLLGALGVSLLGTGLLIIFEKGL